MSSLWLRLSPCPVAELHSPYRRNQRDDMQVNQTGVDHLFGAELLQNYTVHIGGLTLDYEHESVRSSSSAAWHRAVHGGHQRDDESLVESRGCGANAQQCPPCIASRLCRQYVTARTAHGTHRHQHCRTQPRPRHTAVAACPVKHISSLDHRLVRPCRR